MNVQDFYTYIHVSFLFTVNYKGLLLFYFFCCKTGSIIPYAPPRSAQSLLSRLR